MNSGSQHAPKDIISHLASYEDGTLVSLYSDEFTSLTVFRSLRGLAKQYVMNLVLCSSPISYNIINKWSLKSANAHHKAAIHKLLKLKIIQIINVQSSNNNNNKNKNKNKNKYIQLNDNFRECLRRVIFGSAGSSASMLPSSNLSLNIRHPSHDKINRNSKSRWETILNILVSIGDNKIIGSTLSNQETIKLLIGVGLITSVDNKLAITSSGFQFLFQDLHSQIWQIIIAYLAGVERRLLDFRLVLMFLFKLSFLVPYSAYSTSLLDENCKCVVQDLNGLGLLYKRNQSALLFYPTNLSKHLSTGNSLTKEEKDKRGFIIIETTFRVYAYTSSSLRIKLLAKFISLDYRLPNLITGKITKQSIMEAVRKGIPCDLIINYLQEYAHPRMKDSKPILPVNVVDQMRLWESEHRRMKITSAYMICLIPTDREFDEFIHIVTGRDNDERATLLADNGAPDEIQNMIQEIDTFVNNNNKINTKSDTTTNTNELVNVILPPLIIALLNKMDNNEEHILKSKYIQILKKYGFNPNKYIFTKNLNVNDMMKLSDDLCSIHLSSDDMQKSSSKLLWSSKAEKTMVVTPDGRDVLKRHRSQKKLKDINKNNKNNTNGKPVPPPQIPQ